MTEVSDDDSVAFTVSYGFGCALIQINAYGVWFADALDGFLHLTGMPVARHVHAHHAFQTGSEGRNARP